VSERQKVIVYFNSWAGQTAVTSRRPKGSVSLVPKGAVMPMFGEKLPW